MHLGVAMMYQAGTATREFTWEFKRHAQDVGMAKEDAKVHLVSVLNQVTLTHLDAYVTMHGGNKMACLETHPGPAALSPIRLDIGIPEVG